MHFPALAGQLRENWFHKRWMSFLCQRQFLPPFISSWSQEDLILVIISCLGFKSDCQSSLLLVDYTNTRYSWHMILNMAIRDLFEHFHWYIQQFHPFEKPSFSISKIQWVLKSVPRTWNRDKSALMLPWLVTGGRCSSLCLWKLIQSLLQHIIVVQGSLWIL